MKSKSVESVMRSPPIMAWFSDTVSSVVEKMVSNNIGAVIVVDNDLVPFGIITERDIIEKIVWARRDPDKTLAQEIMSAPIITIEVGKSIRDALKLMHDNQIRRLAVTKNGILVGIVTERRILDSLI